MSSRKSEGEELEYPFFEGDDSSTNEWGDYGMSSDDYEGPPIFDVDPYEEEIVSGDVGKRFVDNYVGRLKDEIHPNEEDEVSQVLLEQFKCMSTYIPELFTRFYHGFRKQHLWPLFHYMLPMSPDLGGRFNRSLWEAYVSVNKIFANRIMEVINPDDDYGRIHDYQLMVLPTFLRKRFNRVKLGFFLHIPFSSSKIYKTLHVRDELLRALLNSDLIGLHTFDYACHVLSCFIRLLGISYESKRGYISLEYYGRTVAIKILHVGIDNHQLQSVLNFPGTESKVTDLIEQFQDKMMLLGINDLDIFKGISLKLLAMVACMVEAFEDANSTLKGFLVDRFLPSQRVKVFGRRKSTHHSSTDIPPWEFQVPAQYYLGCLRLPPPSLTSLIDLPWHLQGSPMEELRFPLRKDLYRDLPPRKALFFTTSSGSLDCRSFGLDILSPISRLSPTLIITTIESFIGLWDDCINHVISKFSIGNSDMVLIRKPCLSKSGIPDQWHNITRFVQNCCLFRGEETDRLRKYINLDPSSLMVRKLLWSYMDLPHLLGYYVVGHIVTFCASSRTHDIIIRTHLHIVDLSTRGDQIKGLVPCWRRAGLLSLLAGHFANVQQINKSLKYSDFERTDLGNNSIIDLTPNYMTRVFSSKRKWVIVKEIYDFFDHPIPHSEFIFQSSENDLTLSFEPRGCKLKLLNFQPLPEALKHVTKVLVALHELSFVHPGLKLLTGSNDKCDVGFSKLDKLLKNLDEMEGDYDDIRCCCLSSAPDHPSSVLRLTKTNKLSFVYYMLGSDSSFSNTCGKKKLRWSEMTYAKQVRHVTSFHDCYIYSLTSCNGRVHAYLEVSESTSFPLLVEIKMMVKYGKRKNFRQVVITLSRILEFDCLTLIDSYGALSLLKGSRTELFTIVMGVKEETSFIAGVTKFFKLNMHCKAWEEKTIVFVILSTDATPLFASLEPGGYIHILSDKGHIVYSYHVKDQTIFVSFIPRVDGINDMSSWTMLESTRLEDDYDHLIQEKEKGDKIVVRSVKGDQEVKISSRKDGSRLLNSKFRVLKKIKEFCVCVKRFKFLPLSLVGYGSRLANDHVDSKQEKDMYHAIFVRPINVLEDESPLLLNISLHILKIVMEFYVGVEYLNFQFTKVTPTLKPHHQTKCL